MSLRQLVSLVRQALGNNPASLQDILAVVSEASPASLNNTQLMLDLAAEFGFTSAANERLIRTISQQDSSALDTAVGLATIRASLEIPRTPLSAAIRAVRGKVIERVRSEVTRETLAFYAFESGGRLGRVGIGPINVNNLRATTRAGVQILGARDSYRVPGTRKIYDPIAQPIGKAPRPLVSTKRGEGIISPGRISPIKIKSAPKKPPLMGTLATGKIRNIDRLAQGVTRDVMGALGSREPSARVVRNVARSIPAVAGGGAGLASAALEAAGSTVQRRQTARSLAQQLADQILRQIKSRAPRDTGTLANSLQVNVDYGAGGMVGSSGVEYRGGGIYAYLVIGTNYRGSTSTLARIEITSTVDYAYYVEFGTVNMGAQPYIRPVLNRVHTASSGQVQVGTQITMDLGSGSTNFRVSQIVDGGRIAMAVSPTGN